MINNFRDLSYLGKIKKNKLFRSGELYLADKEEIINLKEQYDIGLVVDLRNSVEIFEREDKLYGLINYHKCSLQEVCDEYIAQDETSVALRKKYFAKLDKLCQDDNYALNHMKSFYYGLASDYQFMKGFRQFIIYLLESEQGVLWHCSLGRDRAGVTTALLLDLLGFDFETIMADYLKSNDYMDHSNAYNLAHEEFLLTFYQGIGEKEDYFNRMGIDEEIIKKLKEKYLED